MAFLAAAPAILSGSIGTAALTAATIAGGAYSARQQYVAGKQAQIEANAAAKREGDAARQDEIVRRRELVRIVAARNALAGAQGVGLEGSFAGMTRRDIRDNRNDLLVGSVNSAARQRALRAQGANAARQGRAGAVTSLLDTATSVYGLNRND